jgi:hypothetical protein
MNAAEYERYRSEQPEDLPAADLARAIGEGREKRQSDGSYMVPCIAHDESTASLHISDKPGGGALWKDFGGCSQETITAALKAKGLLPDRAERRRQARGTAKSLTLAEFAEGKALPIEFLRDNGVRDAMGKYGPVVEFTYRNEDGSPAPRARQRYALSGKKKFCWDEAQGRVVAYGLWLLSEARQSGRLIVVEGESDTLTFWHHSTPALGIPGASMTGLLGSIDFTGVKNIVISQEPGQPGEAFREGVIKQLARKRVDAEIRVIHWTGSVKDPSELHLKTAADPGGFEAEFAEVLDTAELLFLRQPAPEHPIAWAMENSDKSATGGTAKTKEPPRPLRREIPPSEPFPVEAMGELMAKAAEAIHDRVQAPIAICVQSVLAVANQAVQGFANIELPTGAIRPISVFLTTIAESGERKTTADDQALEPVKQREEELAIEYELEYAEYQNSLEAWEKQRSQVVSDKKKYATWGEKKRALDELGDRPNGPPPPLLTCPEPTFEGLIRVLREGALSMGVFSGEGGQFIGGHAMSEEHRLKTASGLSLLWDGEPIKRVRQGDGFFVLRGRRVCLHLLIQPGVAGRFLGDEVLRDQGVLSRVLAAMPDTAAGTRFQRASKPESFSNLSRFSSQVFEILKTPLPLANTKKPELSPRTLVMSDGARALWADFADCIERQIGPGGALEPVRGLANKAPEHATRLAATIELPTWVSLRCPPGQWRVALCWYSIICPRRSGFAPSVPRSPTWNSQKDC